MHLAVLLQIISFEPNLYPLKHILKIACRWFLYLMLMFFISSIAMVLYLRWFPPFNTSLMLLRSMEGPDEDGNKVSIDCHWVSYNNISAQAKVAVIAEEDQRFPFHSGFDYEAIEKAIEHNMNSDKVKGASTISQQVAKNIFLWPSRTYVRKGLEAYFTVLIELLWGKKRILEMYLNTSEMGDGIFGVEAAARYYWHTHAENLSASQAAWIATILPSPRRYDLINPDAYLKGRQQRVMKLMRVVGGVNVLRAL